MLIINFHNVVSEPLTKFDRLAAPRIDTKQFISAINWLSKYFTFNSINELLLEKEKGLTFFPSVALTFDDGYRGVLDNAFPILKERGIPASIMVVTQTLQSSRLFHFETLEVAFRISKVHTVQFPGKSEQSIKTEAERVRCLWLFKQTLKLQPEYIRIRNHNLLLQHLKVKHEQLEEESKKIPVLEKLNCEQLKYLIHSGWTIGSHTCTHRTLSCLSKQDLIREIVDSHDEIQAYFGLSDIPFAYPYGGPQHIGERAYKMVAKSGYSCALTTTMGPNTKDTNLFRLKRCNIEELYHKQPEIFDGV